jgi:4-aminobutyrate aminotransferase
MIGIDFVKQDGSLDGDEVMRDRVVDEAFPRGLLLLGCGKSTIRIAPPLCITRAELDEGLEIFEDAVAYSESLVSRGVEEQLIVA